MLPAEGWFPTEAGAVFEPMPASVPPGSIVGSYRDFSPTDPAGATQPVLVGIVASGDDNSAEGVMSIDPEFPGAVVRLEQGSVFGCVLVDRLTFLRAATWVAGGNPRPASTWEECCID